jgi:serine/threonine protein kinase
MARKKQTTDVYAMKLIPKGLIKTEHSLKSILTERDIMARSNHPFIVKLRYAFQNQKYFAFVMDYMKGGALSKHLEARKHRRLDVEVARYYAAQVLLALEHMHNTLQAVYRDLKPQNILVDEYGNIKITDFGLAKSEFSSRNQEIPDDVRHAGVLGPRDSTESPLRKVSRFLELRVSALRVVDWPKSVLL